MRELSRKPTLLQRIVVSTVIYPRIWIPTAVVAAAFLFLYGKVILTLVNQWRSNDMYSYGFIIPLISLYLVWIRRKQISAIRASNNYILGTAVLLSSLLMLLVGHAGKIITIQEVSLPLAITGVVILLLGIQFLRVLWFPICYLFFMIPVWNAFTDPLKYRFQNFSAWLGELLLRLVGIPVYRGGIHLELPNITLEVAPECSGINYLIAVIAIGIPLAYIYLRSWTRRITLICSAIVIAMLANGLRVALIGVLSYNGISSVLHGPFHVLQALSVSMIGYAALFLGLWILSRGTGSSGESGGGSGGSAAIGRISRTRSNAYPVLLVAVLFLLLGNYVNYHVTPPVPLTKSLQYIPLRIDGWIGIERRSEYDIYSGMGMDQTISRTYNTLSGDTLNLYIGYHEYQDSSKKLVSYKTSKLHRNASRMKIDVEPYGYIDVNRVTRNEQDGRTVMLYWYDVNGSIIADRYKVRLKTIGESLFKDRSNGAIVMVYADLDNAEDEANKLEQAEEFVRKMYPFIAGALHPDDRGSL